MLQSLSLQNWSLEKRRGFRKGRPPNKSARLCIVERVGLPRDAPDHFLIACEFTN